MTTDPRVWSASLPLALDDDGTYVAKYDVRPFNGWVLCEEEVQTVVKIANEEGLQAAFEWLSENS